MTYKRKEKEKAICCICGEEFLKTAPNRMFCSSRCGYEHRKIVARWQKQKELENNPPKEKPKIMVKCPICGKEYESRKNQKYCSKNCGAIGSGRERTRLKKGGVDTTKCKKCKYSLKLTPEEVCCYYIVYKQHSRGCPASECDKFEPKRGRNRNDKG